MVNNRSTAKYTVRKKKKTEIICIGTSAIFLYLPLRPCVELGTKYLSWSLLHFGELNDIAGRC